MKRWSIIRCRMSTLLLPSIYNEQQNIYKKYSSIWYLYTKAEILIDWLRRRVVQFRIVMFASYDTRREKKLSHFDIKSWVTCGTKIRPGKWVNEEYLSQIDSTLRVKLAQHWESNWLNNESQIGSTLRAKLTQHWEPNWLNIESQIDSILRVKLTQYWESNWHNIESQIDTTLRVQLTQIFSSYSLCPVKL